MKIWQESKALTYEIYAVFKDCKDYSFRDQIQRAAVSVMNNIAEGYEGGTTNAFINYLNIAKGSCGEVRSMLHLAVMLNYISPDDFDGLSNRLIEISKMIAGFIKNLSET
ncbi:MAG: four helix bundle protein [Patescibacteria group bacterium]